MSAFGDVSATTKSDQGQKWPFDPPNGWDRDAARLLALIQKYPMMWLCLHRAKYIELRIDTRDCGFNLYDRDHKSLKPDEIVKAIEDLKAQFKDDGTTASREYREGSRSEEPLLDELERLRSVVHDVALFLDGHFPYIAFTEANHTARELSDRCKRSLDRTGSRAPTNHALE